MTRQQQRILSAFDAAPAYGGEMRGLGDEYSDDSDLSGGQRISGAISAGAQGAIVASNSNLPITTRIGGGLMAAGGAIAMIPGGQIPGAIVAAVGALTGLIGGLFKPDLTKIEATHIVDQIESQYLKPNLAAWRSLRPDQKTLSVQAASLTLVDHAMDAVRQGCSNPALGTAGQNCISERLIRGGSAPWCPTGTGCDWYALYRDPIANDPNVIPDSAASSGGTGDSLTDSISSMFGSTQGGIPTPLLIGAALLIGALLWD